MSTPAGWYPDPQDPAAQRYWDGTAWTQHTAGGPAAPQVAPDVAAAGYAPQAPMQATVKVRSFRFGESVRRGFSRWTNYRDRATLAEYWWFYLFWFLVTLVLYAIVIAAVVYFVASADKTTVTRQSGNSTITTTDLHPTSAGTTVLVIAAIVAFLVLLVLFFPQLALAVRRLHDSDKSGWWCLLALVPVGGLVVLVFTLLPGTPGPNRYGPPVT